VDGMFRYHVVWSGMARRVGSSFDGIPAGRRSDG
jgi:hypothetical protein